MKNNNKGLVFILILTGIVILSVTFIIPYIANGQSVTPTTFYLGLDNQGVYDCNSVQELDALLFVGDDFYDGATACSAGIETNSYFFGTENTDLYDIDVVGLGNFTLVWIDNDLQEGGCDSFLSSCVLDAGYISQQNIVVNNLGNNAFSFSLPETAIADISETTGGIVSSVFTLILIILGITIAFFLIIKINNLFPKGR